MGPRAVPRTGAVPATRANALHGDDRDRQRRLLRALRGPRDQPRRRDRSGRVRTPSHRRPARSPGRACRAAGRARCREHRPHGPVTPCGASWKTRSASASSAGRWAAITTVRPRGDLAIVSITPLLGGAVEPRRGLVEQKQRHVANERTGECQPLALPRRQPCAAPGRAGCAAPAGASDDLPAGPPPRAPSEPPRSEASARPARTLSGSSRRTDTAAAGPTRVVRARPPRRCPTSGSRPPARRRARGRRARAARRSASTCRTRWAGQRKRSRRAATASERSCNAGLDLPGRRR